MGREDGSRSCAFGSRCCWLGFAGFALAKNRLALVIGNDAYQHIDALQKARADAKSYADLLREGVLGHRALRPRVPRYVGGGRRIRREDEPGNTGVFV